MDEAVISRLRHTRLAALARDDLNLAGECELELARYGIAVAPVPDYLQVEHAIPAAPLQTAVHRTRQRPRPKQ